jgi:hypothetical protein
MNLVEAKTKLTPYLIDVDALQSRGKRLSGNNPFRDSKTEWLARKVPS